MNLNYVHSKQTEWKQSFYLSQCWSDKQFCEFNISFINNLAFKPLFTSWVRYLSFIFSIRSVLYNSCCLGTLTLLEYSRSRALNFFLDNGYRFSLTQIILNNIYIIIWSLNVLHLCRKLIPSVKPYFHFCFHAFWFFYYLVFFILIWVTNLHNFITIWTKSVEPFLRNSIFYIWFPCRF